MFAIAFQGLRGRKAPFAGAAIALAVAAALVMACATLLQAGLNSQPPVERYAGAIVLAGDQSAHIQVGTDAEDRVPLFERVRISSKLAQRVQDLPGVATAAADIGAPAVLLGPHGVVPGPRGHETQLHPWGTATLTPYRLTHGRAPHSADEVVVDAGLARRGDLRVGQQVRLATNAPALRATVVGIARSAVEVNRQAVVFATFAVVRDLAGVGDRVDAIGVVPAPGVATSELAARIRARFGDRAVVMTGAQRGDVEHPEDVEARDAVTSIGGTFGGIALFIAMFVVASTIGLSVLQREREVALLRAVAATPKQVRRMIRWEAVIVALIASVAGVVPGALIASGLAHALSTRGVAPENLQVAVGAVPVVVAVGSTMLTALAAVTIAGRRAARVRPTVALQESGGARGLIGPARLVGGLMVAAGALGLLGAATASGDPTTAADLATFTSFGFVVAAALLGPLLVRALSGVGAALMARRRGGVSAHLALSNMRTASARFASAMTPLVLTVAISSTLLFSGTTREHASGVQDRQRTVADLVLESDGDGVPRQLPDAIRHVPGVRTATGVLETQLGPGLGATYAAIQAVALDPHGVDDVLALDVVQGGLSGLSHGGIALSKAQAAKAGAQIGDVVPARLGDGTRRRVRVAALYRRNLGFGDAVLPAALVDGHTTSPLLASVLVKVRDGESVPVVADRLRAAVRDYPGVRVGDRDAHAARADHNRETDYWLFRILAVIIFAFTSIAAVNTLMMIAIHRTRELALLRLVGGTRQQVIAMARWEGGLTVTLGIVLGSAIALVTLVPTAAALTGSSQPSAPPALVALVLGSAALVGVLATQIATRIALRTRPVDGIGVHE
jgi:putative ABC transport system permease protein